MNNYNLGNLTVDTPRLEMIISRLEGLGLLKEDIEATLAQFENDGEFAEKIKLGPSQFDTWVVKGAPYEYDLKRKSNFDNVKDWLGFSEDEYHKIQLISNDLIESSNDDAIVVAASILFLAEVAAQGVEINHEGGKYARIGFNLWMGKSHPYSLDSETKEVEVDAVNSLLSKGVNDLSKGDIIQKAKEVLNNEAVIETLRNWEDNRLMAIEDVARVELIHSNILERKARVKSK